MSRDNAISFTGEARKLSQSELTLIERTVKSLKNVKLFFSGGATGVDCYAGWMAVHHHPEAKHRVIIPQWKEGACRYAIGGVARIAREAELIGADFDTIEVSPTASTHNDGYMIRNDMLAVNCTHMVAFPNTGDEEQRSGTWATVRRGRRMERPIRIVPLDGTRARIER